jgi:hypothetical protein
MYVLYTSLLAPGQRPKFLALTLRLLLEACF